MKLFIGIVVAAAAPFALSACGGGDDIAPVAAQHPENLAIWTALGGDSAAPGVVAGVVNAAVAGLLADPVEAPISRRYPVMRATAVPPMTPLRGLKPVSRCSLKRSSAVRTPTLAPSRWPATSTPSRRCVKT